MTVCLLSVTGHTLSSLAVSPAICFIARGPWAPCLAPGLSHSDLACEMSVFSFPPSREGAEAPSYPCLTAMRRTQGPKPTQGVDAKTHLRFPPRQECDSFLCICWAMLEPVALEEQEIQWQGRQKHRAGQACIFGLVLENKFSAMIFMLPLENVKILSRLDAVPCA